MNVKFGLNGELNKSGSTMDILYIQV